MGLRESKLSFIAYEDAVKRVTEDELQRLRVAFKRASGVSGVMALATFAREVLGDGVPSKVAEQIYLAFGGTNKGLTFRDTLCGLVVLTRGTREEKIKFIFNIYSTDGMFVYKDQMERIIFACDGGSIPRVVTECFSRRERLTFEEFSYWLLSHPDVVTMTRWLLTGGSDPSVELTDSSETPTFYQTLARVTHLQELDIIELEKRYWTLKSSSKSGKFDLETFIPLVSPPIPKCLCKGLFHVFDENGDSHIDFREMACGVSACCRGPNSERQRFCFKVFDSDGDGFLSRSELEVMCKALVNIKQENPIGEKDVSSPLQKEESLMVDEILSACEKEKDGRIDLAEYKEWASQHRVSQLFPRLLAQVCHIVLGLKPASREVELQVVRGWLERENQHEFKPSTIWYLVSIAWWRSWREHVSYQPFVRRSSTSAIKMNGTLPNKMNQVDPGLRTRTLGRRESQPTYSQPGRAHRMISPGMAMNGHVTTTAQGPGSIDNTPLIEQETRKVMVLTGEGGRLRRNVMLSRGRDFEVVPEPVWRALQQWYQGGPPLPRSVITPTNGDPSPELELYPVCLRLFRHAPPPTRAGVTTWTGVGLGLSGFGFGSNSVTAPHAPPKKYLAYLASFSRMNTVQQVFDYLCTRLRIRAEDMRLWDMEEENKLRLLEEENSSLEKLGIKDNRALLIEVRNRDMSWPEEMSSLASSKSVREKLNQEPTEKGATGLSNLGNTCFMNSALQCLSNTQLLTQYFTSKCHLYELNRTNPLGMKGHMARRYGDLVEDLWSGSSKSLAPLKLRWTVGRYAPRFSGFQQHDSQEFLSFLLDGLHEDLNRVHNKPYIELKDSDGRPDEEVAREAWDSHLKRNQSVMVDLFQGQLKSQVRCLECGNVSVRFDPFTFLSLPLPMDSSIYVEVVVIHLHGSTPTKYGLLLNQDDKCRAVKKQLATYSGLPVASLLLVEVFGACIKSIPSDSQKIRSALGGNLFAYEIPMPVVDCEPHAPDSPTTPSSGATTEQVELCSGSAAEQARAADAAESADPAGDRKDNTLEARHASSNLQVQDNWFASGADGKRASPEKKRSPKLRGGLNARLGNPFNFNGHSRKSSSSSNDSSQNADHGSVSLANDRFAQNRLAGLGGKSPAANSAGACPSVSPAGSPSAQVSCHFIGFVVAVHRKMIRMDAYFLSPQKNRSSLFGLPVIVPCNAKTKKSQLYRAVWTQVARLLSPAPPGDAACKEGEPGNYPFELKMVQRDGVTCARCPWYRFCRGCVIPCSEQDEFCGSSYVAIEWDPTTLHLRYQSSLEKACTEHASVERSRRLQTEPIDLYECLRAFTKEEELGEDELWFCNKCKKHQLAVKKLEIWSLPPILVIHLKRFQFVNGHWVKSNKIVNFPMEGFDPSAFLVKRLRSNIRSMLQSSVITVTVRSSDDEPSTAEEPSISGSDQSDSTSQEAKSTGGWVSSSEVDVNPGSPHISRHSSRTSLNSSRVHPEVMPDVDSCSQDGADRGSSAETRQTAAEAASAATTVGEPPTYRLYAMSCHTGVLAGGHYISYAHNPNNRWYLYNDSSCKECDRSKMQKDSPYMLFYQRDNLMPQSFLPNVRDRTPDSGSDDEDYENDVRRLCSIQ